MASMTVILPPLVFPGQSLANKELTLCHCVILLFLFYRKSCGLYYKNILMIVSDNRK
jgi:hypothetical protein